MVLSLMTYNADCIFFMGPKQALSSFKDNIVTVLKLNKRELGKSIQDIKKYEHSKMFEAIVDQQ